MSIKNTIIYLITIILILSGSVYYVLSFPEYPFNETSIWVKYSQDYMSEYYHPTWIKTTNIKEYPEEYHVSNIPWISYNISYCASTALQMIAFKYGFNESIGFFNFIMGFTYGSYLYKGKTIVYVPYLDPISGFIEASRFLNIEYHYMVTNNKDLFVDELKYLLSSDIPVILMVNVSKIYGYKYFTPHIELIVGYNKSYLYMYETVEEKPRFEYGAEGYKVSLDLILDSVDDVSYAFKYPWKYSLIYFTGFKGLNEKSIDFNTVFKYIGEVLKGETIWPNKIYIGSKATKALSQFIISKELSVKDIVYQMAMAYKNRLDDSIFLRRRFSNKYVLEASNHLYNASLDYLEVLQMIRKSNSLDLVKIAGLLSDAAQHEELAGELLLKT